ncbi:MAG: IMP dehydrogenase [Chloroflexi bacterium]|nr:IMP dehydrogenase [Chloroflexota bacterium]
MLSYEQKFGAEGLTFDDVVLIPARSSVLPTEVATKTHLTREIALQIPIASAAMDTVTEARLAIALAREGGIGIVHRNLSIEAQAREVDTVKRSQSGMIVDPITLAPHQRLADAVAIMERFHISGVPITENGRLVGILTNRDIRFHSDLDQRIGELMTREGLITAPMGTTLEEAKEILHKHRIEKLPVVDESGRLRGLITVKDIQKQTQYPDATVDSQGRLRVGAAVGVGDDAEERAQELVRSGVDVLIVDTAHGHSTNVIETVRRLKRHTSIPLIAGNIVTPEAADELIEAGADAVKVGVGPGSICTTRTVAGVGVPQLTAIYDVACLASRSRIPVIADGGVRYSGDIAKAVAAGADTVMLGSLLAGVDESPGEIALYQGEPFKEYRGMGSMGAMVDRGFSRDRYFQEGVSATKLIAEGVEGRVPYKGALSNLVYQLVGGLRAAMGYLGVETIEELQLKARFMRVTPASLEESHPHDVVVTKQPPNYWGRGGDL